MITQAAIAVILASVAFAQDQPDHTFRLSYIEKPEQIKEFAVLLRVVVPFKDDPLKVGERSITVRGTTDQLKLTEWLVDLLDKPVDTPDPATHEFRTAAPGDNIVRVFFLNNPVNIQQFQELVTSARTVAGIRVVFTYNASKAMIVRAGADQMALVEWLVKKLDIPPNQATPGQKNEYLMTGGTTDVVRTFYLGNTPTVQDFQEVATLIRTIGDIRQVFTYNPGKAIVVRGSTEQTRLADWLVSELDHPVSPVRAPSSTAYEYQGPFASPDTAVRVFYLSPSLSVPDFQKIAMQLRSATGIRRLFTYNLEKAIAARGTGPQLEQAGSMIQDLDPPKHTSGQ